MSKDKIIMKKPKSSHHANSRLDSKIRAQGKSKAAGDVRIIGGQLKRRLVTFIDADDLRPTPDRLRETLFNWLLADTHGARVLDSCAGSGVLGFESLSRGAAHCTFIEFNQAQAKLLEHSAQQLKLDTGCYKIIAGAAEQVLVQNFTFDRSFDDRSFDDRSFDIVFIDPPYAQDLWQPILSTLIEQQLINTTSLIYLEADKDLTEQLTNLTLTLQQRAATADFYGFNCLKQTQVGQVVAGLYQLTSS